MPESPSFLCFTTSYNGVSLELKNECFVSAAFDPKEQQTNQPHRCRCEAIWDTGATHSAITRRIVDECQLIPTGMAEVYTASGKSSTPTYLVNIHLPNKVGVVGVRVSEAQLSGADVLIGMDIITKGDFAVTTKEGKTVFTFRVPSGERIDFVKQAPQNILSSPREMAKVGRNDLCPCGSGLKYKKCCGNPRRRQ